MSKSFPLELEHRPLPRDIESHSISSLSGKKLMAPEDWRLLRGLAPICIRQMRDAIRPLSGSIAQDLVDKCGGVHTPKKFSQPELGSE